MTIGTFHAICLQLLTEHTQGVNLLDEYEARGNCGRNRKSARLQALPLCLPARGSPAGKTGWNHRKARSLPRHSTRIRSACTRRMSWTLTIFSYKPLRWQKRRRKKNAKWAKRFHYLLVDEFQDINALQFRLVQAWNRNGKSLFVIGDPDQSIYGFRGVGRPLLCPPGRELPGYALHPSIEKLPFHAGDSALRAPGHLGKRRTAAAFGGAAPQRGACALCHGGERSLRGDLYRQGDQPHGGWHRYAGQRRRVLPCGGCAAAQFLRHRRFIPYPPAGRPGGKMPPPGGDSLCNRRARRLLGG